MIEILKEFFSASCKIKNKTIEELLEEYKIEKKTFWNYMFEYANKVDFNVYKKLKTENECRTKNQRSLHLYRELRTGEKTFGEVAKEMGYELKEVIELLQWEYLIKGIKGYSYEKLEQQNINLLRNKKKFDMYFYFLDHDVTFEDLKKEFKMDETNIIFYFDSDIKDEILSSQVTHIFVLNQKRNKEKRYLIQKQKLNALFCLNEEEIKIIDSFIVSFQNKINNNQENDTYKQYKILIGDNADFMISNKLDILEGIKRKLTMNDAFINKFSNLYRFNWFFSILPPTVFLKNRVRNIIYNRKLYACSQEKFMQLESVMRTYANAINHPEIALDESKMHDEQFKTCIFSEINEMIHPNKANKLTPIEEEIYQYYLDHFILFKDLGPIFQIDIELLQNKFKKEQKKLWRSFQKIEMHRKGRLHTNIQKVFLFTKLLSEYLNCSKKDQIENQLVELLGEQEFKKQINNQISHIKTVIWKAQLVGLYLYQSHYDVKDLMKLFGMSQTTDYHTVLEYLYTKEVQLLLDEKIKQYLKTKIEIFQNPEQQKGQKKFINNQTYLQREYKKKGKLSMISANNIEINPFQKIDQIYQFYMEQFILMRDLTFKFQIEMIDLENFCINHVNYQEKWTQMCLEEQRRRQMIDENEKKLLRFIELLNAWRDYFIFDKQNIKIELEQMIQEKFSIKELERNAGYVEAFIRSIQFTIAYIKQNAIDTMELEKEFHIKPKTAYTYLHHPFTTQLLDCNLLEYIKTKRMLNSTINGVTLERNEKGQFVKKYQESPLQQ